MVLTHTHTHTSISFAQGQKKSKVKHNKTNFLVLSVCLCRFRSKCRCQGGRSLNMRVESLRQKVLIGRPVQPCQWKFFSKFLAAELSGTRAKREEIIKGAGLIIVILFGLRVLNWKRSCVLAGLWRSLSDWLGRNTFVSLQMSASKEDVQPSESEGYLLPFGGLLLYMWASFVVSVFLQDYWGSLVTCCIT